MYVLLLSLLDSVLPYLCMIYIFSQWIFRVRSQWSQLGCTLSLCSEEYYAPRARFCISELSGKLITNFCWVISYANAFTDSTIARLARNDIATLKILSLLTAWSNLRGYRHEKKICAGVYIYTRYIPFWSTSAQFEPTNRWGVSIAI